MEFAEIKLIFVAFLVVVPLLIYFGTEIAHAIRLATVIRLEINRQSRLSA